MHQVLNSVPFKLFHLILKNTNIWLLSSTLSQMRKWIQRSKVTHPSSQVGKWQSEVLSPNFYILFYNASLAYSSILGNLRATHNIRKFPPLFSPSLQIAFMVYLKNYIFDEHFFMFSLPNLQFSLPCVKFCSIHLLHTYTSYIIYYLVYQLTSTHDLRSSLFN